MPRKKRMRGAEFKAKVALAAVQGDKTTQQLSVLFSVHPTQVQVWKKQLGKQVEGDPASQEKALASAENAAKALWNALDGIEARRLCNTAA